MLPRKIDVHQLKTLQPYFHDVVSRNKTFEVRKNDRNFKVGDVMMLLEYDPANKDNPGTKGLTGMCIIARITYILDNEEYCKTGYVIIGFKIEERS